MTGFWMGLCTFLLVFVGFLLMFIVLLQRGRGGGLAGAFGGLGGQSAFGTKAGDVFTRITVVLAVVWVVLAGVTGFAMRSAAEGRYEGGSAADRRFLENPEDEGAGPGFTPPEPESDAVPFPGTKLDEGGPGGEAKKQNPEPEDRTSKPADTGSQPPGAGTADTEKADSEKKD